MKKSQVPDLERIVFNGEFKAVKGKDNQVEGYASIFNIPDLSDDIVDPGAFKKTLAERVPKGLVKFIDSHIRDCAHTLGTVISANEDEKGLYFVAELSNAPSVQDTKIKMLEGHITQLSFWFNPVRISWEKRDGKTYRHLLEMKLYEITACPISMHNDSSITNIKSLVPYQDLPLADVKAPFDLEGAAVRVKAWANGNWAKFRKAYLWFDRQDPENEKGYKMQIADIVNGELTVIPAAVVKCAQAVLAGVAPVTEEAIPEIKGHLEKYFHEIGEVAPWNKATKDLVLNLFEQLPESEQKEILLKMNKPAEPPKELALTDDSARTRDRIRLLELSL